MAKRIRGINTASLALSTGLTAGGLNRLEHAGRLQDLKDGLAFSRVEVPVSKGRRHFQYAAAQLVDHRP